MKEAASTISKQSNKIALIGCGGIALTHCSVIKQLENASIIGVYDQNTDRAKAFAKEHGIKTVYESMDALLASEASIVSICTPSGLHAPLSIKCMRAGKHVVVEKPIALSEEDCELLLQAEKETGKKCAPISQLRFADGIRQAKKIIESGALGKPVLCDLYMKYYRNEQYYANSWRGTVAMDGGGALMNQGIHGIDILHFLMGDIAQINGTVRTLVHSIEVEDTAVATAVFQNGALGVIEGTTSVRPGYPRRMELHFEKGSMIIEEDHIISCDLPDFSQKERSEKFSSHNNPMSISYEFHRRQYIDILSAIEHNTPLFYTAEDAAHSVRTILGIYRSSNTQAPVHFGQ